MIGDIRCFLNLSGRAGQSKNSGDPGGHSLDIGLYDIDYANLNGHIFYFSIVIVYHA